MNTYNNLKRNCTIRKSIWLLDKILLVSLVAIFVTLLPFATSLPPPPSTDIDLQETIQDLKKQIAEFNKDIERLNEAINDAANDREEQIKQREILEKIYEDDKKLLELTKTQILSALNEVQEVIKDAHVVPMEVGTLNARRFYMEFENLKDHSQDIDQIRKELNMIINNMVVDEDGHRKRLIFNFETMSMIEKKWGKDIVNDVRLAALELINYLDTTSEVERYVVDKTHFLVPYNKRRQKIVNFDDAIYSFANYLDRLEECLDEIVGYAPQDTDEDDDDLDDDLDDEDE